eukprot:TRINITY_DN15739_c0_g2_i1.p1 TRINITY_DN15739_c0_g2~~TRINITY_DN15739_c0_g2_i1.p1  ORF type:complete len:423 (+),score=106.14 TRINITY_DN15739_c0_g2_i1:188-1456(+)
MCIRDRIDEDANWFGRRGGKEEGCQEAARRAEAMWFAGVSGDRGDRVPPVTKSRRPSRADRRAQNDLLTRRIEAEVKQGLADWEQTTGSGLVWFPKDHPKVKYPEQMRTPVLSCLAIHVGRKDFHYRRVKNIPGLWKWCKRSRTNGKNRLKELQDTLVWQRRLEKQKMEEKQHQLARRAQHKLLPYFQSQLAFSTEVVLFRTIDKDSSNSIDRNEFMKRLDQVPDPLSRAESLALFAKMDSNNDGLISFKEFRDGILLMSEEANEVLPPEGDWTSKDEDDGLDPALPESLDAVAASDPMHKFRPPTQPQPQLPLYEPPSCPSLHHMMKKKPPRKILGTHLEVDRPPSSPTHKKFAKRLKKWFKNVNKPAKKGAKSNATESPPQAEAAAPKRVPRPAAQFFRSDPSKEKLGPKPKRKKPKKPK